MRGALVFLLLAVPASADTVPHKEGSYGGVSPSEVQPRDPAAKPAKPKRPPPRGTLTWIGFEAKDGGAAVFFQSVAPFDVTQRLEGGELVVHLSLTKLGQNTWRQIDTRFFDNPLSGIVAGASRSGKAKPRGKGIDTRIAFKNAKDAREGTLRTATESDGMFYAYVTFPPGTASELPSAPAAAEPVDDAPDDDAGDTDGERKP